MQLVRRYIIPYGLFLTIWLIVAIVNRLCLAGKQLLSIQQVSIKQIRFWNWLFSLFEKKNRLGWWKYVRVGAYDCAAEKESQTDICRDEAYPQWRIFCPLTNSTQLAFDSSRRTEKTTPEDILMWLIKKINKVAPECYGKAWPIRKAIE